MNSRKTYIEIDLKILYNNYKYIKEKTSKEIIPVVKANAYGHGIVEISRFLEEIGIKTIAVAFFEEALKLRSNGIKSEILLFNYLEKSYLKEIIKNKISLTLYDLDQIKSYCQELGKEIEKVEFHINVNTGMNRFGIEIEKIEELINLIKEYKLKIKGIYSHYKDAGNDKEYSDLQYKKFLKVLKKFKESKIKVEKNYISNSAGALFRKDELNYIKPGMALYGLQPVKEKTMKELKNIIKLKSIVSRIGYIKKGEYIGYGKSYKAEKDIYIATIPIGYSDGYKRNLSNKAEVLINGRRCKILGEISMDQIVVLADENIKIYDEVVLIGKQGREEITVENLAELSGTIPDDIVCSLANSIKKIYKNNICYAF